ncbi:alpha/beta hydrolase [Desulfoluna sp.]|uniref:alpha/beta fold hydrolase n=1 Tax=Desulfoluna sp. TaxID=2045199 RepID=UPI00262FCFC2|nr:alpha/beta hydrolase [Desulfoluna sp.]
MPYFTHDDLSLFYRENGTGELLVILPGNTSSSSCHEEELDYFGQTYHAVSFDFRGTGKSQRLATWSQDWWDLCAEDLAALVSHLGQKRCAVMGTSGGALVALLFAIKYPDLVSGVVADSCAELFAPDNLRSEVSERSLRSIDQVEFWAYANGDDWDTVVAADNKLLLDFADQGGDLFKGRLNTITCPVLFTGSLNDSFIPDLGVQNIGMSKQIPGSRVFVHNDGDHPFMWACPTVFQSESDAFLRDVVYVE